MRGQQMMGQIEDGIGGIRIIEVIDVFKNQIINRLRLSLNDRPIGLALTPDGTLLVSVNNGTNTVSIIDPLSMIELARINVGEGPYSAVMDPSGFRAFVLNPLNWVWLKALYISARSWICRSSLLPSRILLNIEISQLLVPGPVRTPRPESIPWLPLDAGWKTEVSINLVSVRSPRGRFGFPVITTRGAWVSEPVIMR